MNCMSSVVACFNRSLVRAIGRAGLWAAVLALPVAAPTVAIAQLINVVFNNQNNDPSKTCTGPGAIGSAGDTWNVLTFSDGWNNPSPPSSYPSNVPLVTSTGATTSLTASYTGGLFCFDPWGAGTNPLTGNYLGVWDGLEGPLTVSGLTPGDYDVYAYGHGWTAFTVLTPGATSATLRLDGNSNQNASDFTAGSNYEVFRSVVVGTDGTLTIKANAGAGGFGAFQIKPSVKSIWTGVGGDVWGTDANWNPQTAPDSQGAVAIFGDASSAGHGSVTLDAPRTAGTIQFKPDVSTTLAGSNALILDNSPVAATVTVAGTHSINAPVTLNTDVSIVVTGGTDSLTINGNIDGATQGITLNGSGTLVLGGNNNYGGTTAINAGTLRANSANALGSGTVTFGGGTLQFTAASSGRDWSAQIKKSTSPVAIDTNNQSVTFGGNIDDSNVGGLTKSGSGTLTLTASNGYTGVTAVTGGTLSVGNGSSGASIGGTSGVVLSNGANITFNHSDPATLSQTVSGSGSLTKSGDGTLTVTHIQNYNGSTIIQGGKLQLASVPQVVNVVFNNQKNNPSKTYTGPGAIGSAGDTWNVLTFSDGWDNSSYPSNVPLLTSIGATTSLTASYTGGTFCFDPWGAGSNPLTGDYIGVWDGLEGPLTVSGLTPGDYDVYAYGHGWTAFTVLTPGATSETLQLDGNSSQNTADFTENSNYKVFRSVVVGTDGTLTIKANAGGGGFGAFQIKPVNPSTASNLLPTTSPLMIAAGSVLDLGGVSQQVASLSDHLDGGGSVINSGDAATLRISSNSATPATFSGAIGGPGGTIKLVKEGTSTQILAGTNTYSGQTTVKGGSLIVNGTIPSTIVVEAAGTLGGTGTVGDMTTSSGTINPGLGDTLGTFHLADLTLNGGSLVFDLSSAASDTIDLGLAPLAASKTNKTAITLNDAGITGAGSWTLIDYGTFPNFSGNLSDYFTFNYPETFSAYTVSVTNDTTSGAIVLSLVGGGIQPGSGTWTNAKTNRNWSDDGNWTGGHPIAAGHVATFDATGGGGTVNVNEAAITIGGMTFDSATGYTIGVNGGNALTLSGGSAAITDTTGSHEIAAPLSLASNVAVSVARGADTLTLSGNISSTGVYGLSKSGPGNLVLSGSNNYSGGTVVAGGTLTIASAGALPAGKSLSIGSGGTLILGGGMAMGQAADVAPVPEPGTLALLAIAGLAGATIWKRRGIRG